MNPIEYIGYLLSTDTAIYTIYKINKPKSKVKRGNSSHYVVSQDNDRPI